MTLLGIQPSIAHRYSPESVYYIAEEIIVKNINHIFCSDSTVVELGAGSGLFTRVLKKYFNNIRAIDYFPNKTSLEKVDWICTNLNKIWPLKDSSIDILVGLEVIEHLENPWFFFRESFRVLKPGGLLLISTPNQISFASKLCLFFRDQFRAFQDNMSQEHITSLLPIQLLRISNNIGMENLNFVYSNVGQIPFTSCSWPRFLKGKLFSDNLLFYCQKSL
jgi:2-polyprenyl-3-methyl-5-hydroxy-6-metoxy-1,4-benzoquinol methylase